ncbi:hypothetical protein MMA231_03747 (plasmid) [Asticcacaulis sp. MM231]
MQTGKAVEPGRAVHAQINHGEVRLEPGSGPQGMFRRVGDIDLETAAREGAAEACRQVWIIIDEQDVLGHDDERPCAQRQYERDCTTYSLSQQGAHLVTLSK